MKKKILILGASFSYIDCIKSAGKMGCEILVADKNPNALGFKYADVPLYVDITDIKGCLKEAKKHKIDGIIAVNDFGVMTAAVVSNELGLPGLPVSIAEICTNKLRMRQVWEQHGVPSVKYFAVNSVENLHEAAEKLGYPLIVKPCDSRGGGCRGVMYVDDTHDLNEVFAFSNSFYKDNSLIAEEFVNGLEHSVEVIIYNHNCYIVAVSDKIKSPLPYRVDDTILYPTVETGKRLKCLETAVINSIKALGIQEGIAHVELSIIDENRAVLFELGARCGGGAPDPLVPYLTGVEEFKEAVRIALGIKPFNLTPLYTKGCVIKFLYPSPGRVESIQIKNNADGLEGVLSFGLFIKKGDIVRPLKTCGDRSGMVITGRETREEAAELANHVIESIEVKTSRVN